MTPAPDQIGHFQITGKLGEGGMGIVYRAHDTKLNREVALKVITRQVTTGEAQLLASMNHPNIAAVYGLEESALVLELVDGPDLAGPLTWSEALPIIHQLIDAIEYAHEKGIIHRDLKPSNIKLAAGETVKVLDFGIAKASATTTTNEATQTMTQTIVGTAAYMSPEQARGKSVDKRTDIWSFGVIVYELLTGQRLFDGETISDTLAQTLTKEVDLTRLPPQAQKLVGRCLQRDPKLRLRDIGDARLLLQEPEPAPPKPKRQLLWPAIAIAASCLSLALLAILWLRKPVRPPAVPIVRAEIGERYGVLSPDGQWIVSFRAERRQPFRLRRSDSAEWTVLSGTEDGILPFWAPDGKSFAFFVNNELRSFQVASNEIVTLAAAPLAAGGSWRGDDIVFSSATKLHHLQVSSKQVRQLPIPLPPGHGAKLPTWLPEGDSFVFIAGKVVTEQGASRLPAIEDGTLYRSSLGGAPTLIRINDLNTAAQVQYSRHPDNGSWQVLFLSNANLYSAPVNAKTGEMTGPRSRLAQRLSGISPLPGAAPFSVSALSSAILYRRNVAELPIWGIHWYSRSGGLETTLIDSSSMYDMWPSPDQTLIAVRQLTRRRTSLDLMDLNTRKLTPLSSSPDPVSSPAWSPDGRYLYYVTGNRLLRQQVQGGRAIQELGPFPFPGFYSTLSAASPDGRFLIIIRADCIYSLDVESPAPWKPVCILPISQSFRPGFFMQFIDGGRWLMMTGSSQSEHTGYFVRWPVTPGSPDIRKVVAGVVPEFVSSDSREGCALPGQSDLPRMLVCRSIGMSNGAPELGPEKPQFSVLSNTFTGANRGAISKDGKRFLLLTANSGVTPSAELISNWTVLLRDSGKVLD